MSQSNAGVSKLYRCKHCKVKVISKTDTRAVLGKIHSKHCPRSKRT